MTVWPDDDPDDGYETGNDGDDAPAELPDEPEPWWEADEELWIDDPNRPFWIDEP